MGPPGLGESPRVVCNNKASLALQASHIINARLALVESPRIARDNMGSLAVRSLLRCQGLSGLA